MFPRVLTSLMWRFGAKGAMQMPVIGWLFNMGVIVWTMLFFVFREIYWGRWKRFGAALLPVLLWLHSGRLRLLPLPSLPGLQMR